MRLYCSLFSHTGENMEKGGAMHPRWKAGAFWPCL
jgi:hypothetical protein